MRRDASVPAVPAEGEPDRGLRRGPLVATAIILALLSVWAVIAGSSIPDAIVNLEADASQSDESLYDRTVDRVAAGYFYYDAAVAEQAAAGYPTSPPVTIRTPLTTWVNVVLGDATPWVLRGLILLAAIVAMMGFERIARTRIEWVASTLLLAGSLGVFAHPRAVVVPEAWAACLLVLSLALHSRGRWRSSIGLGFLAVCFRELAAPYLLVMAVLAWRRGERREAIAWLAGAGIFVALYAVHWLAATRAAAGVASTESPSWWCFGGWPYVVDTFGFSSLLRTSPYAVQAVVLAFAVLGWACMRGDYRDGVLALSLTFFVIFMAAGRPDTAYWGRLYVPLLLPGLAFAPRAVWLLSPRSARALRR